MSIINSFATRPFPSATQQVFNSQQLGCIALRFCDPKKDLTSLLLTSKRMKALVPQALEAQLKYKLAVGLPELIAYSRFLKKNLNTTLDQMIRVKHLNLRGIAPSYFDQILAARHPEKWTSAVLRDCVRLGPTKLESCFRRCPELRELDLSNLQNVNDQVLEILAASCPHLHSINLSNCQQISGRGIIALLKGCPELRKLNLGKCYSLSPADFVEISKVPSNIAHLNIEDSNIDDDGLVALIKNNPGLTFLNFTSTFISSDGIANIAPFIKNIKSIHFAGMLDVSRGAMATFLQGAQNLCYLGLDWIDLYHIDLKKLSQICPALECINVECQEDSDERLLKIVIDLIQKCPSLKKIQLLNGRPVAEALEKIALIKSPNLQIIIK